MSARSGLPSRASARRLARAMLVLLASGCRQQSPKENHEVVIHWDQELFGRLGKANQADVEALLGPPTVRDPLGNSEVWVYQFGSDDRPIRPEYKAVAPKHDELILSFDAAGVLQRYSVIAEGKTTERRRGR